MPKIKIDHIVSFSSEDNVHIASNILNNDMSKKWKSQSSGEAAVSVILQLEKATKISGVDICNECSAFVEVLVGRSSSQDKDYKPILIMSSFMTPMESRDMTNPNRVRLFTYKDLAPDTRDEKWDRIKFNCTQPFNKRCQYGLSYITLYSPEEKPAKKEELVPVHLGKFTLRPESPDTMVAGSLFAQKKETKETPAAEMKKLSSKEWLDKHGTPKVQTANIKPSSSFTTPKNEQEKIRKRNIDLFYDDDDDKPHEKIDKVIAKKREQDEIKKKEDELKKKEEHKNTKKHEKEKRSPKKDSTPKIVKNKNDTPSTSKRKFDRPTSQANKKAKLISKPFNLFMTDVVFTISGIVNPERAELRAKALEMGAKYKPNWDHHCTHLICAFANTPKFKEVQGKGKIVTKEWIKDCYTKRIRFPWRRYALDRNDQGDDESEDEICEKKDSPPRTTNSGTDTEDEIERILTKQNNDTVDKKVVKEFRNENKDKKVNKDPYDMDTDEEKLERNSKNISDKIPKIFDKEMFYIDNEFGDEEKSKLEKMLKITNGYILDEPRIVVDYIITKEEYAEQYKETFLDAKVVSPDWIYDVYNSQKMIPVKNYLY